MATFRPLIYSDGSISEIDGTDQISALGDLIAGSGLGGVVLPLGVSNTARVFTASLANSSGLLITNEGKLGADGVDLTLSTTALNSGVAASSFAAVALASGIAALSGAITATLSGNASNIANVANFYSGLQSTLAVTNGVVSTSG